MIELSQHNSRWEKIFEQEKSTLKIPNCLKIHHVASTAIVGILAKLIIHILAVVSKNSQGI